MSEATRHLTRVLNEALQREGLQVTMGTDLKTELERQEREIEAHLLAMPVTREDLLIALHLIEGDRPINSAILGLKARWGMD